MLIQMDENRCNLMQADASRCNSMLFNVDLWTFMDAYEPIWTFMDHIDLNDSFGILVILLNFRFDRMSMAGVILLPCSADRTV